MILEKRKEPTTHSKAIGIHPPSLEIFDSVDPEITKELISVGLKVQHGICLKNSFKDILGELNLFLMKKPFNFVLAIEQYKTERILRKFLEEKYKGKIHLGCAVKTCEMKKNNSGVKITYSKDDEIFKISTSFVVGCDGKNSIVKSAANIKEVGSEFLDTFMMGDFEDNTELKDTGAIFLSDHGLVESFPLPSGLRRWVCSTKEYIEKPDRSDIEKLIMERTKHDIKSVDNFMLSSYKVQGMVAEKFFSKRMIICGDSAHICSPLGGQGMNCGWMGSKNLSDAFDSIFNKNESIEKSLTEYNRIQWKLGTAVVNRSEINLLIGRKPKYLWLRNIIVWILLIKPLQYYYSSYIAMRYLGYISFNKKIFV
eukprot:gene1032-9936_t